VTGEGKGGATPAPPRLSAREAWGQAWIETAARELRRWQRRAVLASAPYDAEPLLQIFEEFPDARPVYDRSRDGDPIWGPP
jgi:hypothetical protein